MAIEFLNGIDLTGTLELKTLTTNTDSTTALVISGDEVQKRALGSLAFSSATIPTDFVSAANGGTFSGNVIVEDSEIHVGDTSGDSWTRILHAQANGYGFNFQHSNATVLVNEQGSTNQALVLGDVDAGDQDGLFGIAHKTATTSWAKVLNLKGNGELYIGSDGTKQVYHEGHKPTLAELGAAADTVVNQTDFVSKANGGTFSGAITINKNGDALNLRSTTNAQKSRITFSSDVPDDQVGYIEYTHSNSVSYGSGEAFIIGGNQTTTTILADGKLMYDEGIYSKPASGTGAGTRKDSNWDTAYGWGDHSLAGYASGTIPTDFVSAANGGTFSGAVKIDGSFKWATTNATSYTYSNADTLGLYIETVGSTAALSDMRFQARAAGTGNYSSIKIKPSDQSILLGTNGSTRLKLDSSGDATFTGDVTLLEDLYATNQNLKFHAGGTHVMNIDVNGKVYPNTHNVYDLGHSPTLAWRNIYSSGTIYGTSATFTGDITSTGLTVDYTGNRTGDAGILVTNDSSDWGIKVDKDGTGDYGILSQTDGENAIVVRNAAGTNKIQLQGDGDASFVGDVTVGGDLIVNGTTTTLNTTTVEVEDNILQLNTTQGTPDTATAATSGISIYRGDGVTQASLIFDDADDTWDLTDDLVVDGFIIAKSHLEAFSFLYLRNDIRLLNKAENGWLTFADRNTSASEAVYDLAHVGTISTSGNATFGGDINTSTVQISNGNSYNENIRMFPGSNDYSSIILGAVSGTSGTGTGQWTLVRYPSATHSNKFSIRHNSTDALVLDTSSNATFTGNIIMAANATVDGVDISALPTTFAPTNAEQNVNADWTSTSGDSQILNNPGTPYLTGVTDRHVFPGLAASGAQARKHHIGRVYYCPKHWDTTWQNIYFTLNEETYNSGYVKYHLYGYYNGTNDQTLNLRVVDYRGNNSDINKYCIKLGSHTDAGWDHSGQNVYYTDIYLEVAYYKSVKVVVDALGHPILHANPTSGAGITVIYETPTITNITYTNATYNTTYLGSNTLIWNDANHGTGSGLDADKLDGQEGTYYLDYGNFTGTPTIPTTFAPTNAEQNVNADWNATSGDAQILNKPTIPTDFVSAANGGTFSGAISAPTGSTFGGAIKITETGTAQHILIGNQDSGGVDKPAMIRGVNGNLKLGYGDAWTGEGGTMTIGLTLDTNSHATFAGTIGSGAITSTGKITGTEIEGTSLDINGAADISDVLKLSKSNGALITTNNTTDAFGYNATAGLGHYIRGTGSTYIYGGGKFWDGSTTHTLLHSGSTISTSQISNLSGTNTGDQDLTPYTTTDGSGDEWKFTLGDEGSLTGNKWYKVAIVNQGNGGLHIKGSLSNHVESFATQKVDLLIQGREGGASAPIEITGTVDVLHNASGASATDKAGIRVVESDNTTSAYYHFYEVYIRTTRYTQAKFHLTKFGATSFYTTKPSVTSEPAPVSGGNVELDTSTLQEGNYVVDDSTPREIYHEGHKPTYTELGSMAYSNLTGTPTIPTDFVSKASGGAFTGNVQVNSAAAYSFQTSSSQRYNIQIRNTGNTVNSGYGWWLATDTDFKFALHADGAGDRFSLTREGYGTFYGGLAVNGDELVVKGEHPTINLIDTSSGADDFYLHVNSNNFYVLADRDGANNIDSGWDSPHPLQLEGDTNKAYLFGNEVKSAAFTLSTDYAPSSVVNQTDFVSKANGGTFNNPLIIKDINSGGTTTGTTLLELWNANSSDLSQQQSFIDFKLTDTNANFTPQVRIGAQVGPDSNADAISKEGAGSFVVYTSDIGSDEVGGGSLTEAMRVKYNNVLSTQGSVVSNNTSAMNVAHWSASGTSSGMIKITLPGTHSSNWSMLVLRITSYEYNSNNHTVYYVSGHDWTTGWYNNGVTKWGTSPKNIRLAYSSTQDCILLGQTSDSWSYGHVTVDVVSHPSFYHGSMDITEGWEIVQQTNELGLTTQSVTNRQVFDTGHLPTFAEVSSKPTTLSGYGITDAIQKGAQIASGASWTTATKFGSTGDLSQAAGNHALSVRSENNNDAFMSFHIGSDYAVHFGLDGASNRMHVGGWSDGTGTQYQLYDSRDFSVASVLNSNVTLSSLGAAELNHIRSLGTQAFTNGSNPNITTAQVIAEIESDGGFDSYSSVFKTSWSYAGNFNLTDAGRFTETAGSSWITWTDNSSDSTRGNITALAIAPNTGGSAGKVFIYNDQGGSYAPGWREVWTNTSDGSGSGLDADKLDGQHGSYYAVANDVVTKAGTQTITGNKTFSNTGNTFNGHLYYTAYSASGYHYPHFLDGSSASGSKIQWRQYYGTSYKTHTWNSDSSGNMVFNYDGELQGNGLRINGNSNFIGDINLGLASDTSQRVLYLHGYSANKTSTIKTTNGNLHIDSEDGHSLYLNYYEGASTNIYFGTGNGGYCGTVSSAGLLRMANDVVAYYSFSDRRLKTDIKTTENNLEKILSLNPVEYTWKEGPREGVKEIGLIAQEVEEVVPEVVRVQSRHHDEKTEGEEYKQVDYEHLVSTLIGAMQEQQQQIDELKSQMAACNAMSCKCKN